MQVSVFTGDIIMDLSMLLFFGVFLFILLIVIAVVFARKQRFTNFYPPISILVPAYNEDHHITECLKSILKTKYHDMEIICIDDGSTDRTHKIMQRFASKYTFVKVVKGKHEGKSAALNLGLKKAKNSIIVSIDADTVIDSHFLHELVRPFEDPLVGATNGMCLSKKPKRIIEWFQSVEYVYNNLIRSSFSQAFGNGIWFFGAAAAYKKSVLESVDGFSKETMTEDMDISLSIFGAGYKVITVKKAKYYTQPPRSIKELFVQRMRWFYGGFQNIKKHRKLFSKKSFAIKFLFSNQLFWSLYSLIILPIIAYQVWYWLPQTMLEIAAYLFRWFSLIGPMKVLQMIPVWGLNFVNIFGVAAGIVTTILIFTAFWKAKQKPNIKDLVVIFFYFPYTLVLNACFLLAAIKLPFSKKKGFIK